jgi:hypothetical protein
MNGNTKTKLALIGFLVLFLFQIGVAEAAQLRYIRIGEHKAFSRIVFEFRGKAVFREPVVKGKGKVSVLFIDTTTTLPRQILSETTKRVDTIEFVEEGSHLAALIEFPFPYFEVKPFALSSPERVVLDVYQLKEPPEGVVFEESIRQKPAVEVLTKTGEERARAERNSLPEQEANRAKKEPAKDSNRPTPEGSQRPPEKPTEDVATQVTVSAREPPINSVVQTAGRVSVPEDESPSLPYRYGHLQIYLLVMLTVLSVIIVGLLTFIIFRKRGISKPEHLGAGLDSVLETDETMAAIDAKIRDQFRKLDQL